MQGCVCHWSRIWFGGAQLIFVLLIISCWIIFSITRLLKFVIPHTTGSYCTTFVFILVYRLWKHCVLLDDRHANFCRKATDTYIINRAIQTTLFILQNDTISMCSDIKGDIDCSNTLRSFYTDVNSCFSQFVVILPVWWLPMHERKKIHICIYNV